MHLASLCLASRPLAAPFRAATQGSRQLRLLRSSTVRTVALLGNGGEFPPRGERKAGPPPPAAAASLTTTEYSSASVDYQTVWRLEGAYAQPAVEGAVAGAVDAVASASAAAAATATAAAGPSVAAIKMEELERLLSSLDTFSDDLDTSLEGMEDGLLDLTVSWEGVSGAPAGSGGSGPAGCALLCCDMEPHSVAGGRAEAAG